MSELIFREGDLVLFNSGRTTAIVLVGQNVDKNQGIFKGILVAIYYYKFHPVGWESAAWSTSSFELLSPADTELDKLEDKLNRLEQKYK